MRSDNDIKQDVEAELRWSPDVDETDIAVKINDGDRLREELAVRS